MPYKPISFGISAASCPFCGAFSSITWGEIMAQYSGNWKHTKYSFGKCNHCGDLSIWECVNHVDTETDEFFMIIPSNGSVPIPNQDMPNNVESDYLEAGKIVELSPRGAVALLRLSLQKLCKHLGEPGKDINTDIGSLVKRGLNPSIQMALDSVRVIGNNAVHPGVIDLSDDKVTAYKIFGLINFIVNAMITQPREINELYHTTVTGGVKDAIERRDKK